MAVLGSVTEFKTIGTEGPTYEVLEKRSDTVTIRVVVSGEVVKDYPRSEYESDPPA